MNKKTLAKLGITVGSLIAGAYVVFLASPLVLNPIINSYSPDIVNEIKKASGLDAKLEGVKLVTTPKLTAGLKVQKFALLTPANEQVFGADDFQVKMSLLPILAKQIRVDAVQLKNADVYLKFNKDGSLEAAKYLPESEEPENVQEPQEFKLPFGLKLSNNLPDIRVGGYNVTLTDGVDNYVISGDKTEVTDFVLNKSVKVKASGKAVFKGKEQFNYNLRVLNKIMPDVELNDLVFNPEPQEEVKKQDTQPVDVIAILRGLHYNNVTANADADLTIEPDNIKGFVNLTNVSILNLPASSGKLKFKGDTIDIVSDIYTAPKEVSKINGVIKSGKHPNIDINFKSGAEISNILRIIKEIALIFDIKDLQTLSANGKIDADFNIKSNMKTVKSNGYLKIPSANLYYGLYKVGVDNINADIKLDNNNININNIGFSVFNQPLKFYGTIKEDATSDLHLSANQLNLKGLLVALGQAALLKDNNVNSGTVSMKADITGKLDKITPVLKLDINNIDIKNVPANTTLRAPATVVNITSDGKTFSGNAKSTNIKAINPAATVSVPSLVAEIRESEIEVAQTPVAIEKINITAGGKIKNYLTEKIGLDFVTSGDIKSTLSGDMNVNKQTLNLVYATTEPSTIVIPMFDKSKMTFSGNIGITGSMANPVIKGAVTVPSLSIPEIPVTMSNLDVKLNGHILNGSASLQKFTSGGIEAENITSNFSMKGENFYLNGLKGSAFNGKVSGDIVYNLNTAKTSVDFRGTGMDAEKAVYGACGIKNAISGTLDFDTKLALTVADYNEMMKSLKGNLNFSVKTGAFGSIGRIENLLHASNIVTNGILKTTVNTITNTVGFADTAKFDYIDGKLTFANGWADIRPIKSSGALLAYYVSGKYNLINGTTNVNVLGRLDSTIVAKLGPIGELSAEKLFSFIPKFGSLTANIVDALTTDPKGENIAAIPALTSGSASYKDFKVVFNGGLESTSSIKSFKWLTKVDTSAIETKSVSETIKDIKKSVNEDLTNTVKSVTDAVTGSKEDFKEARDQLKNSAEEIFNLFKNK